MSREVFVTGGGDLERTLIEALLERGHRVRALLAPRLRVEASASD